MPHNARRAVLCAMLASLFAPAAMPAPLGAETVPAEPGREADQLTALATGDQLVLSGHSGTLAFAGEELALEDFSGVLGYASQAAYAIAIEGEARIGDIEAERGRMLLVAPFGEGIVSERFDARRLYEALAEDTQSERVAPVLAALEGLADRQDLGVFFGRLSRTGFNVTTMGSAKAERARRGRVGGTAVREVRYSSPQSITGSERFIVERFAEALASGDAVVVGQFLDPLPYGPGASEQGGAGARQIAAEALLARADWSGIAAAEPERTGETSWRIAGGGTVAQVELRRTTDFAFVSSIAVGE